MSVPLIAGDIVYISRLDAAADDTMRCTVGLASNNGRSLMLRFDGGFGLRFGMYVGMMPVFQRDDGQWVEILGQTVIRLERVQ